MKKDFLDQIKKFPDKPGVYQYFDEQDEIIYVGKAKNLKKRVSSYFTKTHESGKTNILVNKIDKIKYIVVETEEDALLLENNLIKKYQPRYNILLKDGKTYPSICITNEPFPRVLKTRNIIKNGSRYFGPYSSNYAINTLVDLIHEIFPVRICKFLLTKENIENHKFSVCLQYHIHRCNAPCVGKTTEPEYLSNIDSIIKIIRGDANEISKMLLEKMSLLAENYKFEEANLLKIKYDLLENYKSKSIISNTIYEETDVFGYDEDENSSYINILRVVKGSIIQGYTIEYKKRIDENKADMLLVGIIELREKFDSKSKELIVPFDPDYKLSNIRFTIPVKGDKKKLLDLSMQNVKQYKLEKLKHNEKLNPEQKDTAILKELENKLKLSKTPFHIECFDNSNIAGSNAVAACIVIKKGKLSKNEYRKYNIKTVEGPDDYASLSEVIFRRYHRIINESAPLPDLIIADGGLGQMEIIKKVLNTELNIDIPVLGLVKNKKHKTNEIIYGEPPKFIGIKPGERIFNFLALIQEEVHRYAIKVHRDKRSKVQTSSELDKIKGIGEKSKIMLINEFKSIKRIQSASFDELIKIIGKSRASMVYTYFKRDLTP